MKFAQIATTLLITCWLTPTLAQSIPIETQIQDVTAHLVGVMDTTAQAQENPNKPSVRMTTCKVIIRETPNVIYLYQEQALTNKLEQPYRQRLLKITASVDGKTVESQAFKPVNPETLIGFCEQKESERILTQSDVGEAVCAVFLKPSEQGYIGETPPAGCPANVRGAVTITNTIILHDQGMDTWDRGYDAQGNQVWGAENEGYQYRWVNPNHHQ